MTSRLSRFAASAAMSNLTAGLCTATFPPLGRPVQLLPVRCRAKPRSKLQPLRSVHAGRLPTGVKIGGAEMSRIAVDPGNLGTRLSARSGRRASRRVTFHSTLQTRCT